MLGKFIRSRSGNFAILSGLAIVPLCLAAGVAIDYSRHLSAQKHLQEMVDATSLSLASSREKDQTKLERLATDFLTGNQNVNRVHNVRLDALKSTNDDVDISVSGSIPTTFMALAGYERLDVRASALAERAVNGRVEVALVLDNTDSMSLTVSGTTRIAALKTAANKLVDELLRENDGAVRIGLVPYGEYVNVGTTNRNATWLSVAADYSKVVVSDPVPEKCDWVTETSERTNQRHPNYDCSYSRDGTWTPKTCQGDWIYKTVKHEPKWQCKEGRAGSQRVDEYKWFGCVTSRRHDHPTLGPNRLHDGNPSVKYTGMVERSQRCLTPIVPLTSNKAELKNAIDGMITKIGNHVPVTYIPAGIVWGWNILSPSAPFAEGAAYDPANQRPRKVAVIMTDGANTMRFNPNNGQHVALKLGKNIDDNSDVLKANYETNTLCSNMKNQGIEIFTVAFMVESAKSKETLETCATDRSTHYFDASDSDELLTAFENIGNSLRVVRLAR